VYSTGYFSLVEGSANGKNPGAIFHFFGKIWNGNYRTLVLIVVRMLRKIEPYSNKKNST
jgi:hypothetical protein